MNSHTHLVDARVAIAMALTVGVCTTRLGAHPGVSTSALLKVDSNQQVTIIIAHDALALAVDEQSLLVSDESMFALMAGTDAELDTAFSAARERFSRIFELTADERAAAFVVTSFPAARDVREWQRMHPAPRLPIKLDIVVTAQLPAGTRAVSVRFPNVLASVILTVDRFGMEPVGLPIAPGERSPEFRVGVSGVDASVGGGLHDGYGDTSADGAVSPMRVAWRYIVLGFEHIIPEGLDHALFVLGLFLLTPRVKPLLWQVTAFTVAHSTTLILSTFGLVRLPAIVVEPAIAASIAFVAIENLARPTPTAWRPVVAFGFGLLHGLGFASALTEAGLPAGQLVLGVIAFNIGVEAGHLLVLAAAFILLGWSRNQPWYRKRVAMPISLGVVAIALYWFVERLR